MKNSIKIFILILFLVFSFGLDSISRQEKMNDPKEIFHKANRFYDSGDYSNAILANLAILETGRQSGNLYYNLGNSYLKKGQIGKAVLNYDRARLFMPRDGALLANLRYAKSLMKQRDVRPSSSFIARELNRFFNYFTLGEMSLVFNVFYFSFAFLLIFSLFAKRFRVGLRLISFVLLCVTILFITPLRHKVREMELGAVVIKNIVDAKLEPSEGENISSFPLYEGMRIHELKKKKGWKKVKRPDKKIGWVKEEEVESLF